MKRTWPPETGNPDTQALQNADLAEYRARILARYWDDSDTRERNLSVVDWWLEQPRPDEPSF
jgi:hypothetical protein